MFQDRFWRKNRSPSVVNSSCIGTDLNRNWNYQWGQGKKLAFVYDKVCMELVVTNDGSYQLLQ